MKTIGICSDHAELEYKTKLIGKLKKHGLQVIDYGTDSEQSCDYCDFAHKLARGIENGEVECGIALCGTGNGMAMTLNHHPIIRAGLAWNTEVGKLVKQHNNANVLVLPARFISYRMASAVVDAWMDSTFEGGRHLRRIEKIPVL